MPWGVDDVLAGIGGGAEGAYQSNLASQKEELARARLDLQSQVNEIRMMLGTLQEKGRNDRAANSEEGKNTRAQGRTDLGYYGIDTRARTAERGQDLTHQDREASLNQNDEHYWDKAGRDWDLGTASIAMRGKLGELASSTARRGQDLTHGDRSRALDQSGDTRAINYAMKAYDAELKRKKQANSGLNFLNPDADETPTFSDWVQQTEDPEVFPSVRRMFAPSVSAATPAPGAPAAPAPVAPAAATPAAPGPKAPLPVAPKLKPTGGKVVSSADLDAFAAATKRTRAQAEAYAAANGWTIQ